MSDDFGGTSQNLEKKEGEEDDSDDDDNDDELEKEMGETEEGAEILDQEVCIFVDMIERIIRERRCVQNYCNIWKLYESGMGH